MLDAGCGPGWVSGYLHSKSVDVSGIDLSPRMIEHARRKHPEVSFDVASVTDLNPEPGSLGGVLGWWSWFNLPREWLPRVIASMARGLRPNGQLIVGMHRGDGDHPRTRCYGDVPVEWATHLYQPDEMTALLKDVGLEMVAEIRLPPPTTFAAPANDRRRPKAPWLTGGPVTPHHLPCRDRSSCDQTPAAGGCARRARAWSSGRASMSFWRPAAVLLRMMSIRAATWTTVPPTGSAVAERIRSL